MINDIECIQWNEGSASDFSSADEAWLRMGLNPTQVIAWDILLKAQNPSARNYSTQLIIHTF